MIVAPCRQDTLRQCGQIPKRRKHIALDPFEQRRDRLALPPAPFDSQIKAGQSLLAGADALKGLGTFHPEQRAHGRDQVILLEQVASENRFHRIEREKWRARNKNGKAFRTAPAPRTLSPGAIATAKRLEIFASVREQPADLDF